jgi:uncharacterized membrane protein
MAFKRAAWLFLPQLIPVVPVVGFFTFVMAEQEQPGIETGSLDYGYIFGVFLGFSLLCYLVATVIVLAVYTAFMLVAQLTKRSQNPADAWPNGREGLTTVVGVAGLIIMGLILLSFS